MIRGCNADGATGGGADAELEWVDASKSFWRGGRHNEAIRSVSFSVGRGERVALTGPSGCGKTTLLNMAAGFVRPTGGFVRHAGRMVTGVNTSVGYVTQRDTVLPWRTVRRNVELALEIRGVSRRERGSRVTECLDLVGLSEFDRAYPSELSGGMLKRLLLARTLVYGPRALLLDEPFGALDAQLRLAMHAELQRIWATLGTTIVFVTHDIAEAVALADRVLVFGGAPARLVMSRVIEVPKGLDPFQMQFDPACVAVMRELWEALGPEALRRDSNLPERSPHSAQVTQ